MITLDTRIIDPQYLYILLAVFVVTYVLILLRKREEGGIPRIGVTLAVVISLATYLVLENTALALGLGVATVFIGIAGKADEVYQLSALSQFILQLGIVGVLVAAGWTIPYVSNPIAGGILDLSAYTIGAILVPGSILAFLWIVFFMNAINWIDGVDGLAGSVVLVAFAALVVVSLLPQTQDRTTLVLSLIGLGAVAAFLIWNFPPATVYLGTTGSWFLGMYIALVAMHGGGKIVTSALVLALPAIDAIFVLTKRLMAGKPPWKGDRVSHIHHRLLLAGMTPRSISLLAFGVSALLAVVGIAATTTVKIILLTTVGAGFFLASLHVILRARSNA